MDVTQMPLRLPSSLHEALKVAARKEGVSLNQYCLYLLAKAGPAEEEWKRRKGEDLLRFLEEATLLQKEFDRSKRPLPPEKPTETLPERLKRLRKIRGKN